MAVCFHASMDSFVVAGDNQFAACRISGEDTGALAQSIDVAAATPALYAALVDPASGLPPDMSKVEMTVTGPGGTAYAAETNTADVFVGVSSGKPAAVIVLDPAPGRWTLSIRCTAATSYAGQLQTAPIASPLLSAMSGLAYYEGDPGVDLDTYRYDSLRWGFLPFAAAVAAAAHTPGLRIPLAAAITAATGLAAADAQALAVDAESQTGDGVLNGIAQRTDSVTAGVTRQLIRDGAADDGLTGWTILEAGGAGWRTESGYAESIEYAHNFAVSTGWCRKGQLIDLGKAAGLTPEFLDTAPDVSICDFITADYPGGAGQSRYSLIVKLLDAGQNTLKLFQTGEVPVAPLHTTDDGAPVWQRISATFTDYGPGARFLYFEHGGIDAQAMDPRYGLKITGAEVRVPLGPPGFVPPNLLANGSGAQGTAGWTLSDPAVWRVETGPGAECRGSQGNTNFAVREGVGTKSQVIDLVAAGYPAAFLDTAPLIQATDWICAYPDCTCFYGMTLELWDENQSPLRIVSSGQVTVTPPPGDFTPFRQFSFNVTDYGPGLRYLRFEHSASHDEQAHVTYASKVTGTRVTILTPFDSAILEPSGPDHPADATPELRQAALFARARAVLVTETTVVPYRWVCFIWMTTANRTTALGSGWLIPQAGGRSIVVTAAHNVYLKAGGGWSRDFFIQPAEGRSGGGLPYTARTVGLGAATLPFDYLVKNQADVVYSEAADYAVIVVEGTDWDASGFTPVVANDATLSGKSATITGFPASAPYGQRRMYTESAELRPSDETQIVVDTDFQAGASGCPVYTERSNAVGLFSHGSLGGWGDAYAMRINQQVLDDITRWSTPLSPRDRIKSLKLVIRTGDSRGAGTDDDIVCDIDGHRYALDADGLWVGGAAGRFRSRNERGDFDGYDLTRKVNEFYPDGLTVGQLVGRQYGLRRDPSFVMYHSLLTGDWEVESVAWWINGQLLMVDTFNAWVYYSLEGETVLRGTFRIG